MFPSTTDFRKSIRMNDGVTQEVQGIRAIPSFLQDSAHFENIHFKYRCPGGKVPDFGRMFLKLKYPDITKNTYIRSWTVTEIMAREKCGLHAVPRTVPGSRDVLPIHCACPSLSTAGSSVFMLRLHTYSAWNPKGNYEINASVYVVQFNGFMSLTC